VARRSKPRYEARRSAGATVAKPEPSGNDSVDRTSNCEPEVVHAECRATIRKLQMIVDGMEKNDCYSQPRFTPILGK